MRCSSLIHVLLAAALLYPAALPAKDKEEAKKEERREKHLAKARELYERGRFEKSGRVFALAAAEGEGECMECLLGAFRAAAAGSRYDEAVPYAGALLDAVAGSDDAAAATEEIQSVLRGALEATGGDDPDVLWGVFDVLARLGRASEVVRLADLYLDTPQEKSLICGADVRASLAEPADLPVAAEINEQLRALSWDGPLLVSDQIRRPRLRNKSFPEGAGARMAGVVDRTGFLSDVRLTRPVAGKLTGDLRDRVRRAMFDPATYRGQRIETCYPFSVKVPSPEDAARAARAAASGSLYEMVRALDSVDAVVEMAQKAGPQVALTQRAAVCAAQVDPRELNQRLRKIDWPGPFLDDAEIVDPVPQETPPVAYTEEARAEAVEGRVVLSTVIDENGRVAHAEAIERLPGGLTGQAVSTVRGWTYKPATYEDRATMVCLEVTVEFDLEADP